MKIRVLILLAVWVACSAATAGPSFAHHGIADYDQKRSATVKGTVTDFVWANPHGLIEIDVPDAGGNIEKWQGFLTSPNFLAREGWTKNTLKPGDEITITGNPSKSQPKLLKVNRVVLASGQELRVNSPGGM